MQTSLSGEARLAVRDHRGAEPGLYPTAPHCRSWKEHWMISARRSAEQGYRRQKPLRNRSARVGEALSAMRLRFLLIRAMHRGRCSLVLVLRGRRVKDAISLCQPPAPWILGIRKRALLNSSHPGSQSSSRKISLRNNEELVSPRTMDRLTFVPNGTHKWTPMLLENPVTATVLRKLRAPTRARTPIRWAMALLWPRVLLLDLVLGS